MKKLICFPTSLLLLIPLIGCDSTNSKKANSTSLTDSSATLPAEKISVAATRISAKDLLNSKEAKSLTALGLSYKLQSISFTKQMTFDSYSDEYHYKAAERDNIMLVVSVVISSDSKDPSLFPVYAYKWSNGALLFLGMLDYRFARWEDYATYLGNYADHGNDFAYSKSIPFKLGVEIGQEETRNSPIVLIVKKNQCIQRNVERFSEPPVSYSSLDCSPPTSLTVEDLREEFTVIKIFNRKLLR
jgi:hypothetical protein